MEAIAVSWCWPALGGALPKARLEYSRGPGAEGCPDEREVASAVANRLGYDPFDPAAPEAMRARIEHEAGRFTAVLALATSAGSVQGERRLESDRGCAELVAAMALSMSIVIDPARATAAETANAAPAEAAKAEAAKAEAAKAEAAKAEAAKAEAAKAEAAKANPKGRKGERARRRVVVKPEVASDERASGLSSSSGAVWGLRANGAAHVSFGTAPATAFGGSVSMDARSGRWSLSVGGRYDAAAGREASPRGRIETELLAATLAPCLHHDPFLACIVGLVGSMHATSTGVTEEGSDSELFAALGARIGAERAIAGDLSWTVAADVLGALRPLSVRLGDASVWDMPRASVSISAGLQLSF